MGNHKKECPNCAVEVPKEKESCPLCGYEFPQPQSKLSKWVAILLILLFLIPLVMILIRWLK